MQMIWPSSDPLRLPLKAHTLDDLKVQITCFVYNLNSFEYIHTHPLVDGPDCKVEYCMKSATQNQLVDMYIHVSIKQLTV